MLNYSAHALSDNGAILSSDIYSLDYLLSNSTHQGVINPNSQIIFDNGVTNLAINRYGTRESAVQAVEYLKAKNFDFSASYDSFCVEGKLSIPWWLPASSILAGFSLTTLCENIAILYYNCKEWKASKDPIALKNLKIGSAFLGAQVVPIAMTGSYLFDNWVLSKNSNIVKGIIGLKNCYYGLSYVALGSVLYDAYAIYSFLNNSKKYCKSNSKNFEWKNIEPRIKRKIITHSASAALKTTGGIMMYYSSSLDWLTVSGSSGALSLITKGATIGSFFGTIGSYFMLAGLGILLAEGIYYRIKKHIEDKKKSNNNKIALPQPAQIPATSIFKSKNQTVNLANVMNAAAAKSNNAVLDDLSNTPKTAIYKFSNAAINLKYKWTEGYSGLKKRYNNSGLKKKYNNFKESVKNKAKKKP